MTQLRTQWLDEQGAQPDGTVTGWTGSGINFAHGDPLGALAPQRKPAVGRRFGRLLFSGSSGTPAISKFDAVDALADRDDVELLTCVMTFGTDSVDPIPATEADEHHVYARGAGPVNSSTDFYRAVIDVDSNEVRIEKRVASVDSVIGAAVSYTFADNSRYMVLFKVDGTDLTLRVWNPDTETEPTTWTVTRSDSDISAAGWVGVGGQDASADSRSSYFNFFCVATGSEAVLRPKTNAEQDAWLAAQSVNRVWLVELAAVGFAPATDTFTKSVPFYLTTQGGYTTAPHDVPANRQYIHCITKAPAFESEMSTALAGRLTTNLTRLVVVPPPGQFEAWRRYRWQKSACRVLVGDPDWCRWDFIHAGVGRVRSQPTAQSTSELVFELSDLSDVFDVPLRTATVGGSGPRANEFLPLPLGLGSLTDPVEYDPALGEYTLSGPNGFTSTTLNDGLAVYDGPAALDQNSNTVAAVDAGTDTITADANHGMVVDYTVLFETGTPPAPLALGTPYFVVATPGLATFRLAATPGGAVINLTTTSTGASFRKIGYIEDVANGRITLASPAAIRLIAKVPGADAGINNAQELLSVLYRDIAGLDNRQIDRVTEKALSLLQINQCGIVFDGALKKIGEAIDVLLRRAPAWLGWSPDGLLQVGQIDLPASDAVMTFTAADILDGSLKQVNTILPLQRSALEVRYQIRDYTRGVPQFAESAGDFGVPYKVAARLAAPAAGTPLEDTISETKVFAPVETLFQSSTVTAANAERDRLATLFGRKLSVWTVNIRNMRAMRLTQGLTVAIDRAAQGWKTYNAADPLSTDTAETFDGTKAVVLSAKPNVDQRFVTLLLVRQDPLTAPEFAPDLPPLTFSAALVNTVVPEIGHGAPSFTRASTRSFTDYLGSGGTAGSGEVAFKGARRTTPAAYGERLNFSLHTEELTGAAWSGSATVVTNAAPGQDGIASADSAADASAVAFDLRTQSIDVPDNSVTWYVTLDIKKTTGATAKSPFLDLALTGGTPVAVRGILNTDSGAELGAASSIITDLGGYWRYAVPITNNGTGNTQLQWIFYPAAAAHGSASADAAETGTHVVNRWQASVGVAAYEAVGNTYPFYGAMVDQVQYHKDTPAGAAISWSLLKGVVVNTTTASDVLTYPTPGNVPAPSFALALDWSPQATGMGTVWLWASYVDANNYTALLHDGTDLIARKRIAGVNNDATIALTVSTSDTFRCAARFSETAGVDVFLDGAKGANDNTTTAPQIGATFGVGNDGNGTVVGSHCFRRLAICPGDLNDEQMTDFST